MQDQDLHHKKKTQTGAGESFLNNSRQDEEVIDTIKRYSVININL